MTNKATFDNIPKVSLGKDSDMFLVSQDGVAVSQKRKELSASLGNASWTNTVDYLEGSEVIYNNKRYRALQDNGISFGNISTPDSYPMVWLDLQEALDNKYSPENKPTANDVQALPLIGGSLTGDLKVDGANIYTKGSNADIYTEKGEIIEQGQRVYSPNNNSHIMTSKEDYNCDVGLFPSKVEYTRIGSENPNIPVNSKGQPLQYGSLVSFREPVSDTAFQIICDYDTPSIMFRSGNFKTWGQRPWYEFYHTGNKPTIDDVTGLLAKIQELETRLLNLGG